MAYPNYSYAPSSSTTSSSSPSSCPVDSGDGSGGVEGGYSEPFQTTSDGSGSGSWAASSSVTSSSGTCEAGGGDQRTLFDSYSANPLRYANGEIREVSAGLKSRGYGVDWGHTLSYSNQVVLGGSPGINGWGWFIKEVPQLGKDGSGHIAVIGIINDAIWFNKSGSVYVARFFSPETLVESGTGSSNEFTFTDAQGQQTKFFGFDAAIPAAKQGQFKSITDAYGHTHTATYDGSNRITTLSLGSSPGISYNYEYYTSGDNEGRLQYVTLKRGTTNVRRVSYTYHGEYSEHGLLGDLKDATLEEWNGGWDEVHKSYFRYYITDEEHGVEHGLKFVVGPEACARLAAAGKTDPDAELDGTLEGYADKQFLYDGAGKVTSEVVNGQGSGNGESSSSTTRGTYEYDYYDNGYSGSDFNTWKTRTTETRPDGHKRIVYCNHAGQPMLRVLQEYSGGSATGNEWYEYFKYDSKGRLLQRATSEAVASYSEDSAGLVTLNSSAGLIHVYEYYPESSSSSSSSSSSGEAPGYLRYEKVKQGNTGTAVKVRELQYVKREAGGKTVYPVWKEIVYQSDSGGGSSSAQTSYGYTWFSGTVQMEQRTTTWPVVTAAQHGSNSAEHRYERFDEYGRLIWIKDERGFLTRLKYDDASGGLVQRIDDVDTTKTTDEPDGWVTPSGGGLHLITDYTVDNLGRPTQVLGPEHQIDLSGTATNVRRADWTVYRCGSEIRSGAGYLNVGTSAYTLIEPVTVIKLDASRRTTDVIVSKRDPSESGALTAGEDFDTQSRWVRWSKNIYINNQRSPNATRVYFSIPTTGGGDTTNNYNLTAFGFDDMDRRTRTATPGGTITKLVYEAPGRVIERWVGTDDSGGAGENMVKVEEYQYDGGSDGKNGNLTRITRHEDGSTTRVTNFTYDYRNRRAGMTGEVNTKEVSTYDNLDRLTQTDRKNGSTDVLIGRQATSYDNRGRVYQRVRYAVNPSTGSVGNSLKQDFWYDPAGNLLLRVAPGSGALHKAAYDGVGRVTKRYVSVNATDPTYSTAGSVTNDTVLRQEEFTYDDAGNLTQQTIRERFHDATGAGELQTPSTNPKARVSYQASYPDSTDTDPSGTDQVKFEYNRVGEITKKTDQLGTVHELAYDALGRLEHDRVTTVGTGVDSTVRRISRSYEIRGLLEKITSYDNATVGSGTVVNEVQHAYDDFEQLVTEYQSHSGTVNTGTSPKVQYAHANGSDNHTRLTSLTYPDGRVSAYDYGTTDATDDLLCRVASIKQSTTVLAGYSYLGPAVPVRVNYSGQPGVELTYIKQSGESDGDAGDQYIGLDRFGRLVDQRWLKTSGPTDLERLQFGFDRASNREWRRNTVAGSTYKQDEYYTCDALSQLKTLDRGVLNSATPPTGISGTPTWEEDWNYDPTGNWHGTSTAYLTKVNGSTTLNQNRTHNKANEMLTVTGTPNWVDPTHDAGGNMTKIPQPVTPTSSYDGKYDAWDRLVEVKVTGGATVATYGYDGLKRRVTKVTGGNTRHYYYSNRWQVLEERLNTSSSADRQFVWGLRHVDDLILRDRDNERLYALHDQLSVTALVNTSGTVQERYGYDGFGTQRVMTPSWGSRSSSSYDWEIRFGAYRFDTETALCQVRNRYYHAGLGRWVSTDTLEYGDGANLYSYVEDGPIDSLDAPGLINWKSKLPWFCLTCAAANYRSNVKTAEGNYDTCLSGCPGRSDTDDCVECCTTIYRIELAQAAAEYLRHSLICMTPLPGGRHREGRPI